MNSATKSDPAAEGGAAAISVIVPAFNAEPRIERCLGALRDQLQAPDEVIVVDDGSTDATAERAAELGARVIRQPNRGPAAARNRGAREARGELLLFTDDDCAPEPTWTRELVAPLADPAVAGAKGTYRSDQPQPVARFVQLEYEEKYERMAAREGIDFIDTYSAAYRRTIFLEAGGFDESFHRASVEDQELSFRLAERGLKMVFAPRAVVDHEHVTTMHAYARRKFGIGYWKATVVSRHPSKLVDDAHTPQSLKAQVALAGAISATLPLLPRSRPARRLTVAATAGFAASTVPTLRFVFARDARLLPLAPALLGVRAFALGLGLSAGALGQRAS